MLNKEVMDGLSIFLSKKRINQINFRKINTEKDIFSSIFENISSNREKYAQFYTHKELVTFILNNINFSKNNKVLDPACGAGAFLIELLNRGINPDNLYGIDIDKTALEMCKFNAKTNNNIILRNLINKNTLNGLDLMGGFDLIIGNPPFKNLKRDNIEYDLFNPLFEKVTSNSVNSATLMIVKSWELLNEEGYLGFVLPKNLIRVESFSKLRKFILDNFLIKMVVDLDHHFKDVRGDQIILILQKNKSEEFRSKNKVKIIPYKKGLTFGESEGYYINQIDFEKYPFFPLFYNLKIKELSDKLIKVDTKLSDFSKGIFRGISIGSNHKAVSKARSKDSLICYRGDSIKRFGIKYPLYLNYSELTSSDINKLNRLKLDKIIIQNICSKEGGIFATISNKEEVSLDTVTNIILNDNNYMRYIASVLNSKLSNFFMIFVVYLNSNFTMHTDKSYIGGIPIVKPTEKQLKKLNEIFDRINSIEDKYSKEFFEEYHQLNNLIYRIYNLSEQDIFVIEQSLKEVMSKRQNG